MTLCAPVPVETEASTADAVARMLLSADGTLTDLLEAFYQEELRVVLLRQIAAPAEEEVPLLELAPPEPVLKRRIVIKGQRSNATYLYANTCLAVDRLDSQVRRGVLSTDAALGRLWKRYGTESFKEILDARIEPASSFASYFSVSEDVPLIVRQCRVSSGGNPVALLTEYVRYPALTAERQA